jgi:replicative DNA helicase
MINQWSAVEAEQIFLGAVLTRPARLMDCQITTDAFLVEKHRIVFDVMQELDRENESIDIISVSDALNTKTNAANKFRWLADVTAWQEAAFVDTFFDSSQKIIIREYRKREISRVCYSLNEDYDADAAIQSLMNLDVIEKKHTHTIAEALHAAVCKAEELSRNGGVVGLPTGLTLLDEAIAGLQAPDLYVIGARPAMGKTAVAINLMLSNNCAAGFFSTEQPMEQIGLRSLSIQGGISARKIRSADLDEGDLSSLMRLVSEVKDRKVLIHDKANLTISDLMREARNMKYNHDIKAIYVDYIQRIKSPKAENRRLEVADVVTGLKTLARELEIPVIALAQVSREVTKRPDKRPHMGDLLESGVIEQEADVVMLLYRDEVYNEQSNEKGVIEILIDKNRHGPTGRMKFAWIGDQMKIADLSYQSYPRSA